MRHIRNKCRTNTYLIQEWKLNFIVDKVEDVELSGGLVMMPILKEFNFLPEIYMQTEKAL